MFYLEPFGATHAGKVRKNNEDSLLVGEGRDGALFAVADGIGGFEAGEVASSIAINALKGVEPSGSLEGAIKGANRGILQAARSDEKLSGMGTTVVAARFGHPDERPGGRSRGEPTVEIAHVGDSRAYLLRGGELRPVTEDHSLVAELVRSGDLTRAEASEHPQRNLITRALGAEDEVKVDTAILPVEPGDRFLLCSDGLSDMVPESKIGGILTSNENPKASTEALVQAALDGGGADNITVVVVDVREEAPADGSAGRNGAEQVRDGPPEGASDVASRRGTPRRVPREAPSGRSQGRGLRGKKRERTRKKRFAVARALAALVRGMAALLVLAALASPFYLWANSQYYLGFEGGVVVIYKGLPYAPLGYQLNREVERTGLRESEVDDLYRDQIVDHELKSREEAERIVRDLEAADPPTRRR